MRKQTSAQFNLSMPNANGESLQRESVARYINVHGENGLKTAAAYSGLGALL